VFDCKKRETNGDCGIPPRYPSKAAAHLIVHLIRSAGP
jgi:hypothetical protein